MLRKRADSKAAALGLLTDIQTCIRTDSLESQYELTANELGRGKFAVVKRCIEKSTGKDYAAKFLKKRRRGRDCRAEIIHEVAILEMARWNTRIISLHEVYETDHEIILVLEYNWDILIDRVPHPFRHNADSDLTEKTPMPVYAK
ncbi:ST17B kinase, partial [Polypterus senegalus]